MRGAIKTVLALLSILPTIQTPICQFENQQRGVASIVEMQAWAY